jgi:hypothetical protein
MRILVSGIIGQYALGGLTLHYLQFVLGLKQLGHDVYYIEDNGAPPFNPLTQNVDIDYSFNLPHLSDVMQQHGLGDRWAFMHYEGEFYGLPKPRVEELYRTADLWLNISGATIPRDEHMQIPRRAFLDTDPGFQQMAIADGDPVTIDYVGAHNVTLTFGENIGKPTCLLPTDRFNWQPCRQPVILDLWEPRFTPDAEAFTTVTNWKAYAPKVFRGEEYGQKDIELRRFIDLPKHTSQKMELAICAFPDVVEMLEGHGWRVVDPVPVTSDIAAYRNYLAQSRAEWSVAKNIYVKTWSGWISERDINYLASGKPVLTQDTGLSENVPVGEGLLAFSTMEECVSGIDSINSDYAFHCRRARELAADCFGPEMTLKPMLERCQA